MIIEVVYPLASKRQVDWFEVEQGELGIGDIVVVNNEEEYLQYGVVTRINRKSYRELNKNKILVADELDRSIFWNMFEESILDNRLSISNSALEVYRSTKGNENTPIEQIRKKLTRNLLLVHRPYRIPISKKGSLVFQYGCLRITYGNGKIYNLHNHFNHHKVWKKDMEKYKYYTELLGIEV